MLDKNEKKNDLKMIWKVKQKCYMFMNSMWYTLYKLTAEKDMIKQKDNNSILLHTQSPNNYR